MYSCQQVQHQTNESSFNRESSPKRVQHWTSQMSNESSSKQEEEAQRGRNKHVQKEKEAKMSPVSNDSSGK